MKLRALLKVINALNQWHELEKYRLDRDLGPLAKDYFQAVGIEAPLPLQTACYNLCTSDSLDGRWLVQLETGSGKTALCFPVACHYSCNGNKVLVVNESEELTFRDFKKAEACC